MEQKTKKTRWWVTLLVAVGLIVGGVILKAYTDLGFLLIGIGLIAALYVPYELYKNSKK